LGAHLPNHYKEQEIEMQYKVMVFYKG
jgi:hypothetical protein